MTNNTSHAHIHEFIPSSSSNILSIDKNHLELLHQFMLNNPIYSSSHELKIDEINRNELISDKDIFQKFYPVFISVQIFSMSKLVVEAEKLGIPNYFRYFRVF